MATVQRTILSSHNGLNGKASSSKNKAARVLPNQRIPSATSLIDNSSLVLQPSTRLSISLGEYLQTACTSHLEVAEKCLEPFLSIYHDDLPTVQPSVEEVKSLQKILRRLRTTIDCYQLVGLQLPKRAQASALTEHLAYLNMIENVDVAIESISSCGELKEMVDAVKSDRISYLQSLRNPIDPLPTVLHIIHECIHCPVYYGQTSEVRSLYSADLPVAPGMSFLLSDAMLRVVRHSGWEAGPQSPETTDCLQDSIQELSHRLDLLDGLMCHDEELSQDNGVYREIREFTSLVKMAEEDLGRLQAVYLTNTKASELAEKNGIDCQLGSLDHDYRAYTAKWLETRQQWVGNDGIIALLPKVSYLVSTL